MLDPSGYCRVVPIPASGEINLGGDNSITIMLQASVDLTGIGSLHPACYRSLHSGVEVKPGECSTASFDPLVFNDPDNMGNREPRD